MRISEIFRLVLMNLKQNKSKVFLTSLGIIVGTITIVLVIAIGEGGKQDVAEQFTTLNAGTITVSTDPSSDSSSGMGGGMAMGGGEPGGGSSGGSRASSGGGSSGGGGMSNAGGSREAMMEMMGGAMGRLPNAVTLDLEESDLENILFFVPNITTGAILGTGSSEVFGGDLEEATSYTIIGTESTYAEISNLTPIVGTFLTEEDEENTTRCVILGYDIAIEIFGSIMDAYDSQIEIDGRAYIVNGVLASMGTVVSGVNPDTSIFMPYSTAEKYILGNNFSPQFSVLASDVDEVENIMTNIETVLKQDQPDGQFMIEDAGATMDAAMQSANTLSLLLVAVAAIVFIVGGIGIMNVLFVSVKERTREIGVLKAIGTKKRDILFLFLLEASMIGVLGGVMGIGLSFVAIELMVYTSVRVIMTASSLIMAFGFAVITSSLFGFYPALKASNLVPIEALNNE